MAHEATLRPLSTNYLMIKTREYPSKKAAIG
ncbi:Putative protein [Zobellia galactanivorans]|uniref:Uncharacterized protein n=1 Tax=Zobellia galactanivorans (strain DSM 12802 / CCUG 47099 / CIP 106680 / NCIMB 13871 / Dsij) TaxID=63186 RepID=G0L9K4_ZOBGA|nr:Putative protein [Zobellia galactanivorans]